LAVIKSSSARTVVFTRVRVLENLLRNRVNPINSQLTAIARVLVGISLAFRIVITFGAGWIKTMLGCLDDPSATASMVIG